MAEKKTKIRPIGPNILVKPEEAETTTKSGIVLMSKDEERPQRGEVVALGSGIILPNGQVSQFVVKTGDKVLFRKYGGNEVELDGTKYLVMTEAEVLAIIED